MTIAANYPTIRPTLDLNFAATKELDPRITFSRPTTATYYDGKTVVKAEENLLKYSQDFSQGVWATNNSTKTTTTLTDPAGGNTGLTLTKTADSTYSLRQFSTAPAANTQFTISVYLKGNAGDTVGLYMDNSTNQSFGTTVTLTSVWTRYTLTNTFNSTSAIVSCGVKMDAGFTATSVDVAFFQLEQRSTVTAYTPTTTAPITNYIPALQTALAGVPRFDCNPTTGESLGLLIEEQRTNLVTYSSAIGGTDWAVPFATYSANIAIAPDGTQTASLLTATGGGGRANCYPTAPSTSAFTFSVYVKSPANTGVRLLLRNTTTSTNVSQTDFVGATFSSTGSGISTPVGNGWYRCSITASSGFSSGDGMLVYLYTDSNGGVSGTSILAWGAQLEAGSFPTSYIPTVASQVTRSADSASMTGSNFSSWYRADEGTVYSDTQRPVGSSGSITIWNGTTNNSFLLAGNGNNFDAAYSIVNGVTQAIVSIGTNTGTSNKKVFAYKSNYFAATKDGASVSTVTSGSIPVVTSLSFGSSAITTMTIKRIAYYPARLSNTNLQAITS